MSEALSEVMTASDYKKVEAIILYLEDNKYVTPQIAEKLTGKISSDSKKILKKCLLKQDMLGWMEAPVISST